MPNNFEKKKAGVFYLFGTIFNKGIGFITVPIFTRLLTQENYGIVTTYNSWVSIVGIFVSLALYMSVRAAFIDYSERAREFTSVIIAFTLIYGTCLSVLILGIIYLLPIKVNLVIVIFCLIQAVSSAVLENASMYYMMRYRYKVRTAIMVIPNFISTILAFIAIKFIFHNEQYLGRIIPNVLVYFVVAFIVALIFFKNTKVLIRTDYLKYALRISAPLILHAVALNILSQSDRTMITSFRNASETAIYGLVYNFSMIALVVTTSLDGIWVPFFTEKMKQKRYEEINNASKKYIELITVVIAGVILVGPEVIRILAPVEYWEGTSIIPAIVGANFFIFLYTMYVNIEHFYKKTFFISVNTLIAAGINIILNLIFIKKYGYVGAAYTTITAYVVSLFLHYLYARKLNDTLFPLKEMIKPMIEVIIATTVFYAAKDLWIVRWIVALSYAGYTLIYEREMIKQLINRGNT